MEDIIDAILVSHASIYRWKVIFEEHRSAVHTLYEQDSDLYLDELVLWLAIHHNIVISVSALHENLKEAGLTRNFLHKIALERDEELRAQWREMQRDPRMQGDGSEFVCLDETSKNELSYARRYGLAPSGQRAELKDVFVCGDRYSLLATMTVDGYLATHVVPGSYDSLEFYEFVQENVLPHLQPFPAERSILVLDNCRIHHNEALVQLVQSAGALILYLPAYSPNLNPIKESFSTCMLYTFSCFLYHLSMAV